MNHPAILHLRVPRAGPGLENQSPDSRARLREFCVATTPFWEVDADGAYLDLTGTGRLLGWGPDGPATVCSRAGRSFSLLAGGVGPTLLSARLASLLTARLGERGVLVVPGGSVSSFLASFPVGVLQDRPALVRRLQELGVRTLGDLQTVPRPLLRAVFGDEGDGLAAEAAGYASSSLGGPSAQESSLGLLVGARFDRPLASADGLSALLDGLALRALVECPGGPASRFSWQLQSRLLGGRQHMAAARSQGGGTLADWRSFLRRLWARLPVIRQGLVQIELQAGTSSGGELRQGLLFPGDERARQLALALVRINGQGTPGVRSASEQLLSQWGVCWYGAASDRSVSGS